MRFLEDRRISCELIWAPVKLSKQRVATSEEHEREVIQILKKEPHVGQRELARMVGISQSSVWRIVKENKFHPYHLGPRA